MTKSGDIEFEFFGKLFPIVVNVVWINGVRTDGMVSLGRKEFGPINENPKGFLLS
jgi:hypothetical protein